MYSNQLSYKDVCSTSFPLLAQTRKQTKNELSAMYRLKCFSNMKLQNIFLLQVKTFLIMYRAHCQRILDTILRANFAEVRKKIVLYNLLLLKCFFKYCIFFCTILNEFISDSYLNAEFFFQVQNFLVHFWQGMPAHITVILSNEAVIDLIGNCDNILYKVRIPFVSRPCFNYVQNAIYNFYIVMSNTSPSMTLFSIDLQAVARVLIPSSLQPLPASLTQAIQQFAKQLSVWLEMALYHLPEDLQHKKISGKRNF